MEEYVKKELRLSKKTILQFIAIMVLIITAATVLPVVITGEFELSYFLDEEVLSNLVIFVLVFSPLVIYYIYQHYNNFLVYGNYGFVVNKKTYAYNQVTELRVVRRYRRSTVYRLYVGDEVIFKFYAAYDNKDDFIALLQKNGIPIIT